MPQNDRKLGRLRGEYACRHAQHQLLGRDGTEITIAGAGAETHHQSGRRRGGGTGEKRLQRRDNLTMEYARRGSQENLAKHYHQPVLQDIFGCLLSSEFRPARVFASCEPLPILTDGAYKPHSMIRPWVVTHRLLGPDTLTQHTCSNAASSVKGRAEMCCDSTASPGTLVASVRPLLHMTTSRLEFTVTGMRVYVGTGWLGDKAQALTHECWSCAFPEKQLQRGWRDAVQIPRITRNRHCERYGRHPNPVNILHITRNCPCGR